MEPSGARRFSPGGRLGRAAAALAVALIAAGGASTGKLPAAAAAAGSGVEGAASLRGELVPGVAVLAFREAGPGPNSVPIAVSAKSDANGRYRLLLPAGSYHLLAVRSAGPPWPFPGAKDDLFSYYLGNPVVVEAGRFSRVAFNMVQVGDAPPPAGGDGAGVAGQVTFEGAPLARAYVHVYPDAGTNFRGMGLASVPTGDDGRFRIKLPPGSYYVLARKRQGGGMYGPPGKDDYVGYFPGNPVVVRPARFSTLRLETTLRVDLLEEKLYQDGAGAGWVSGRVSDAAGEPASGLYILFYRDSAMSGTPALVAGPTDARGGFRVRAASGRFHLLARSNLGGPLEEGEWHGTAAFDGGAAPSGGIRITVRRFAGQ